MQAEQQVPVVYIGNKPFKTDNINGTETVWKGKGDVQPYPLNLAGALLRYSDVWRLGKANDLPDDAGAVIQAIEQPTATAATSKPASKTGILTMGEDMKRGPDPEAPSKSARTLE